MRRLRLALGASWKGRWSAWHPCWLWATTATYRRHQFSAVAGHSPWWPAQIAA